MGSAPHKRDQRARAQIQPPCTHWLMLDNIDRLAEPSVAKLVGNRRGQPTWAISRRRAFPP